MHRFLEYICCLTRRRQDSDDDEFIVPPPVIVSPPLSRTYSSGLYAIKQSFVDTSRKISAWGLKKGVPRYNIYTMNLRDLDENIQYIDTDDEGQGMSEEQGMTSDSESDSLLSEDRS